jgi:uncharacterized protein (DUF488 family)
MGFMTIDLMTAGYEGQDADAFVAKLKAAGVRRMIDIRYLPSSRKKGLSKGPLSWRLADEGIEYMHVRELGTPKAWRDDYKRDHDFVNLARRFRPYLEERIPVLRQVFEWACEKPSALMCYESEAHHCHRSLVALRIKEVFGADTELRIVDL